MIQSQLYELKGDMLHMEYRGASVYDQEDFHTNYMNNRDRKDSPNNAIESPIIYELLGDFQGKSILDLGCGSASFGKELLNQGARFYTGIEGSERMAALANQNLTEVNTQIHQVTMESYNYPTSEYEIITSRFAIHYVEDIESLFQNVHQSLKDGGRFIFSIQHPLTTSSFKSKQQNGDRREDWIVDDYFHEGERKEPWIQKVVVKYHRTIEHYFKALIRASFTIEDLREGTPEREYFTSDDEFERRQRIPLVLIFSCRK